MTDRENPVRKDSRMLISPDAQRSPKARHGGRVKRIAELRSQLASPSQWTDGDRQRLLDLAQCVARVQTLGSEYSRVSLSESAQAALDRTTTAV